MAMGNFEHTFVIPDRYSLTMEVERIPGLHKRGFGAIFVAGLLLFLVALNALIPASNLSVHNVLHHLNFLPLMIAGMLFGWRGALLTAVCAGGLNALNIANDWRLWPLDA